MENTQLSCLQLPHTHTLLEEVIKECEEWKMWYWACDCNLAMNSGLVWENYSMLEIILWRIGNFCSSLLVTICTLTSRFTRGMSSSKVIGKTDSCYPKIKLLVHTHNSANKKCVNLKWKLCFHCFIEEDAFPLLLSHNSCLLSYWSWHCYWKK